MYVCMYIYIYKCTIYLCLYLQSVSIYLSIYIYILGIFHTEFASQGTGQGRSWSSFHRVPRREFHHLSLHRFENGNVTCKPRMMMLLFENWVFWCVLFEISDHCLKYFTDTPIYIYMYLGCRFMYQESMCFGCAFMRHKLHETMTRLHIWIHLLGWNVHKCSAWMLLQN